MDALKVVRMGRSNRRLEKRPLEKSDSQLPAGAIPEDRPAAGVGTFTALASLLSRRKICVDTAMTGEISLRGLVLPVGGIKQKVVAAHAAGIRRVLLPARNKRDYGEIPEGAKQGLEFVWCERVDDALGDAARGAGIRAGIVGRLSRRPARARACAGLIRSCSSPARPRGFSARTGFAGADHDGKTKRHGSVLGRRDLGLSS